MTALAQMSPFMHDVLLASLDVLAKATLLMLLGLGLNALLRGRRRVLARSAMFNALLAGLVLLPAASLAFPRWRIPCLPAPAAAPARTTMIASPTESEPCSVLEDQHQQPTRPLDRVVDLAPAAHPDESTAPAPLALANTHREPEMTGSAPAATVAPARPFPWAACAWAVYLSGAALLPVRLLVNLHAVHKLRRSGQRLTAPAWAEALDRWRTRLNLTGPVELATSPTVTVPLTFGWLRPVVMIPAALVETLDGRQRDAVLLHELAHVRRGDYAWQLLFKCVQAAYWVHPLVWLLGRSISATREQACDDLCAFHAATVHDYRTALVEIVARLVRRPAISLGIAMARTPNIARRLARIDEAYRSPRCVAARSVRVLITGLALAATAIIGPIELASRAAAEPASAAPSTPNAEPPAAAPATTGPIFRCDEPVYRFPDAWAGEIVEHTWTVHNDGDALLKIQVQSPCGCMKPEFDPEIAPGGQGKITIRFNTRGYSGDVTKSIFVRTNAASTPPEKLQQQGKILKPILMDPPTGIQFPYRASGADLVRSVTLTNHTSHPLQPDVGTTGTLPFKYEIQEIKNGQVYRVVVTLEEQSALEGVFQIPVKTGLAEEPTFYIPVNVPPIVQLSASSLAVAMPLTQPYHREISVKYNGAGAMQLKGVAASDPAIKVETVPAEAGRAWKLRVDIPRDWAPQLPVGRAGRSGPATEITIETDLPARPKLKLSIITFPQPQRLAAPNSSTPAQPLASTVRLGFAILPTLDQPAGDHRPTNEQLAQFLEDLRTTGPEAGRKRHDEFQWFEAACELPPDSITSRRGSTTYVLLQVRADSAIVPSQGLGKLGVESVSTHQEPRPEPASRAGQAPVHHVRNVISLTLDHDTGQAFRELTKQNLGMGLAAIIDDRVVMQASIRSEIGAHVQIDGNFTAEEAQRIVTELSAGGVVAPATQPATRPAVD